MSGNGYTPLFGSLTTGTLCGRWPDIGLWPVVLSMSDRYGDVDVTPQYIANVSGLELSQVIECMRRFCEPDPFSRSREANGARLVLLDPARDWGWRVVNHGQYRERARLASKSAQEVESGENKARMGDRRPPPPTAVHRRRPPPTPSQTQTETKTKSKSKSKNPTAGRTPPDWLEDFRQVYPKRAGDQEWNRAARAGNARLTEGHTVEELLAGAGRYASYISATGKTGTEYVKQAATFLGPEKSFLLPWDLPPTKADARYSANMETARQWALEKI